MLLFYTIDGTGLFDCLAARVMCCVFDRFTLTFVPIECSIHCDHVSH
jgi:hypothetical protein